MEELYTCHLVSSDWWKDGGAFHTFLNGGALSKLWLIIKWRSWKQECTRLTAASFHQPVSPVENQLLLLLLLLRDKKYQKWCTKDVLGAIFQILTLLLSLTILTIFYCCQFYNFNNFDSALGSQNISIFSRDRVDSVDNIDNVDNVDTYFYYLFASRWWGKSKGDRA